MNNFIEKIKKIRPNKFSILIYIVVGMLVFIPGLIIMLLKPEFLKTYQEFSLFLIIPLLLLAFLIDSFLFLKKIWNTIIGKILYIFIAYFSYSLAIVYAKKAIYLHTNYNPDVFQSSINILAGIYIIPAGISIISDLLFFFTVSFISLFVIGLVIGFIINLPILFYNTTLSTLLLDHKKIYLYNIVSNLFYKLFKLSLGQLIFRTFMFCFIFSFIGMILFYLEQKIKTNIDLLLVKPTIVYSSYYENKNNCKNSNLNNSSLIKFLDTDNISSVNMSFNPSSDEVFKIEFNDIEKCERKD